MRSESRSELKPQQENLTLPRASQQNHSCSLTSHHRRGFNHSNNPGHLCPYTETQSNPNLPESNSNPICSLFIHTGSYPRPVSVQSPLNQALENRYLTSAFRQHLPSSLHSTHYIKVACPLGKGFLHTTTTTTHYICFFTARFLIFTRGVMEGPQLQVTPNPVHAFSYTHLSCPERCCVPFCPALFLREIWQAAKKPSPFSPHLLLWSAQSWLFLNFPPPSFCSSLLGVQGVFTGSIRDMPPAFCGSGSPLSFHTLKGRAPAVGKWGGVRHWVDGLQSPLKMDCCPWDTQTNPKCEGRVIKGQKKLSFASVVCVRFSHSSFTKLSNSQGKDKAHF